MKFEYVFLLERVERFQKKVRIEATNETEAMKLALAQEEEKEKSEGWHRENIGEAEIVSSGIPMICMFCADTTDFFNESDYVQEFDDWMDCFWDGAGKQGPVCPDCMKKSLDYNEELEDYELKPGVKVPKKTKKKKIKGN